MCGLLSLFSPLRDVTSFKTLVSDSSSVHSYRGPDDHSVFCDKNYCSSFHRLAIRGLSLSSRQPITSPSGRYVISFNGEIYRYGNSVLGSDLSDTEYLASMLDSCGLKSLHQLRGMYAIVIYDKELNSVTYSRDPLGIKPLFVSRDPIGQGSILVSSSVLSIREFTGIRKTNSKQVGRFLLMGVSSDTEETFFEGIERVVSGSITTIDRYGHSTSVNQELSLPSIDLSRSCTYDKDGHRHLLTHIIKSHFLSDIPISSTLSSGIDSSFISALAALETSTSHRVFTSKPPDSESEVSQESPIVGQYSLNLEEVPTDPLDIISEHARIVRGLGAPIASSSWLLQNQLFSYISTETALKVLLVGEGADEIYSGYRRLVYPYMYSCSISSSIKSPSELSEYTQFLGLSDLEAERRLNAYVSSLATSSDYEDQRPQQLFPSLALTQPFERYYPGVSSTIYGANVFYKKHLVNYLTRADIPNTLEVLDYLSMSYGIEVRVPYLDIDLIDNVMSFYFAEHMRYGLSKYMLRMAASEYLPRDVCFRREKRQRPSSTQFLVYDVFAKDFLELLSSVHIPCIDSELLVSEFSQDLLSRNAASAGMWFRIYSYCIFASQL